jgi:glutamine amidotransferase
MCELLGMSANVPTDICFSFTGLIERGGRTGPHADGWGIAFYEGRGCRCFHDPLPGVHSAVADLIRRYAIKSRTVISHIRRANHGRVCLENTHPFTRELWGRTWSFAHNGQLPGVKRWPLGPYRPVGTTDSEHAFCWLLGQVRQRYPATPPRPATLHRLLAQLCRELDGLGVCNLLLSDARHLYAYGSTELCWLTRRAPFGTASLVDTEVQIDFAAETAPDDVVSVVATRPLTRDEAWQHVSPGTLLVFRDGACRALPRARR